MSIKDDIMWRNGTYRKKVLNEGLMDTNIKVKPGASIQEIKADIKKRLIEEIDAETTYSELLTKLKRSVIDESLKEKIAKIVSEVRMDERAHIQIYTNLLNKLDNKYEDEKNKGNEEFNKEWNGESDDD